MPSELWRCWLGDTEGIWCLSSVALEQNPGWFGINYYLILLIFWLLIDKDCVFACFLLFFSVSCIFHYSVLCVRFYNKIKIVVPVYRACFVNRPVKWMLIWLLFRSSGAYNYDSTSIRRPFDCLTRSWRSRWRNMGRWPASRSHADLFMYSGLSTACHSQLGLYGRNVGRRIVVAPSNYSRMAVERRSNYSRIVVKS